MLRFKPEVRVQFVTEPIATMLQAAACWSVAHAVDVEVNSIDDPAPARLPNTLHGYSLAIDFDVAGDVDADNGKLADYLARVLPPGYDVVFEGNHVHVEYDMHRPALRKIAG